MRMRVKFAVVLLGLFLVSQWQPVDAGDLPKKYYVPVSASNPNQQLFNEAVLIYSNAVRKQNGRAPLRLDPALARAAGGHAANMARHKRMSHELPVRGQKVLKQRMNKQSVSYFLAAENIAMNKVYQLVGRPISTRSKGCQFVYSDTRKPVPIHTYASLAQQAVARWAASPKHRSSLLSKKFTRLGSGLGVDPSGPACGDTYMVQNFVD
jgi:uncharacterized protein YkwD